MGVYSWFTPESKSNPNDSHYWKINRYIHIPLLHNLTNNTIAASPTSPEPPPINRIRSIRNTGRRGFSSGGIVGGEGWVGSATAFERAWLDRWPNTHPAVTRAAAVANSVFPSSLSISAQAHTMSSDPHHHHISKPLNLQIRLPSNCTIIFYIEIDLVQKNPNSIQFFRTFLH